MSKGIPTSQMSQTDLELFRYFRQKFVDKYDYLLSHSVYAPMHFDYKNRGEYQQALQNARIAGMSVDDDNYLDGEYKPFQDFEKQFKNIIAKTKEYRDRANDNINLTFELYAKDNGLVVHPDDMIPRRVLY